MSSARCLEIVESIVVGLLKDAQTDTAYEYVMPFHQAYAEIVETQPMEYLQIAFISAVRREAEFRNCIRSHDLVLLETIALRQFPDNLCGPVREFFLSVGVPDLFRSDTAKKMWKRLKKLVYAAGLGGYVYGDDNQDADATEETVAGGGGGGEREHSIIVQSRIDRFNQGYRDFLGQLREAFPPDEGAVDVQEEFDRRIGENQTSVLEAFKAKALPLVPKLAAGVQESRGSGGDGKGVVAALEQFFGPDCTWVSELPLLELLPISKYWTEQMAKTENKHVLMKALGELALCMSGIDTLIYSPIVTILKNKALEIMRREKLDAGALTPGSPSFSNGGVMKLVMELVHELPAATGYRITSADIEALMTSLFSGSGDLPESFSEVFSPDMIDADCIDMVAELPGIGDAIAPILAGYESQSKGHIGVPAFGSVQKPGWMTRDRESGGAEDS